MKTLEKPTAPDAEAKKARAAQRKARLQKQEEANRVTFALQGDVRRHIAAQAKAEGMDMGHFMQKLVENHVLATAPADDPLARRIAARRAVIDAAVTRAKELDAAGKFEPHFILSVMKSLAAEPEFRDTYAVAVGDTGEQPKRAARERVALNQQLGRLVKRAAGARSARDEKGKIQRAQVQDEMISSYTLLAKPA
ncbi:MAG TPA: hypothetical protein DEA05_08560 [Rhodobacteraceae bacterium]|nr:hypothetical protein [Paracoccaceae bacterium]